ncbi:MAG: arginine--tRNA ligase [Mariprofundaceae bacterium]
MKEKLETSLQQAAERLCLSSQVQASIPVNLTRPKDKAHGDYAANTAMILAGKLGIKPRQAAEKLLEYVAWPVEVEKAEIAGPGFINITLHHGSERDIIKTILMQGEKYGIAEPKESSICLEFVSANPTGPMHVGHGRGAVVGDALATLLAARGYSVHKEYYINDAGAQIRVLSESVWLRICELQGETINLPEGCYPGEYIVDVAKQVLEEVAYESLNSMDSEKRLTQISVLAMNSIMAMIRDDLAALHIQFDHFFSEKALHASGKVETLIAELRQRGLIYQGVLPPPKGKVVDDYQAVEQLLFRATDFGDDVDRPLAKQDGTPTYFAADIAYHHDKCARGFNRMIDIWGADHGGYITRVQAATEALTGKQDQPEVVLVQMVNLTRDGQAVKMSKRAGTFVTLREVVDEVGSDAVRFNFLTRRVESRLDFDLAAATAKNEENPVYYVQYAYARIQAVLKKVAESNIPMLADSEVNLSILPEDEGRQLIKMMLAYPDILEQAASKLEPYRVATWLMKLAAELHTYYHKNRVVGVAEDLSQARILLLRATGQVIRNGLTLLGVHAPEKM